MSDRPLTLRVFISSTFRDMQTERERLIKFVFPRIRRECERRGGAATEIDLRWGITEEESRAGHVLPICLAEINRCNVLIGMLGDFYGTPARLDAVPEEFVQANPWLLEEPSRSYTELEIEAGVFRPEGRGKHVFFYLRAHRGDRIADNDALGECLLANLKARLRASTIPVREYTSPDDLGSLVFNDLMSVVAAEFPDEPPPGEEQENRAHAAYLASHGRFCVGRDADLTRLDQMVGGGGRPIVVSSSSGIGKTNLLAAWIRRANGEQSPRPGAGWRRWIGWKTPTRRAVVYHFVGANEESDDWPRLLRHVLRELRRQADIPWPIPERPAGLAEALPAWLQRAARTHQVIFVLDGLDRLRTIDAAKDLDWLPTVVPSEVSLIVSAGRGPVLEALRRRPWQTLELTDLAPTNRVRLAEIVLAAYGKRLTTDLLHQLAEATPAGNPLYLSIVVEELRVLGSRRALPGRLADYLAASDVATLNDRILRRWEEDYDSPRPHLVRDTLSLLAAARHGLTEAELLDLLGRGRPLPALYWSPLRSALGDAVVESSGVLRYFHPALREAVGRRYLAESEMAARRRELAGYFRGNIGGARAVAELPWLLAQLGDGPGLARLLASDEFLTTAWPVYAAEVKAYAAFVERDSPGALRAALLAVSGRSPLTAWAAASLLFDSGWIVDAQALAEMVVTDTGDKGAAALGLIADCRLRLRDAVGAARALEGQAGRIPAKNDRAVAANRIARAVLLSAAGQVTTAANLLAQVGPARDEALEADYRSALARLDLARKRYRPAIRHLRAEERTRRLMGDLTGLQICLSNLGVALRASRAWNAALRAHAAEEAICRRLGDRGGLQICLGNQAVILMDQGNYDEAYERIEARMRACREVTDNGGLADAFRQRAYLLGKKLGQRRHALEDAQEAARLATTAELPTNEIDDLIRYLSG
jgi:tetratricopeptide (TPR) repeat protein